MMRKFMSLLIIAGLCLGLSGCGGGDGAPKEKVFLTEDEYASLYTSPNDYKGKYVELTGKIFTDPEVEDGKFAIQMWGDPDNNDKNTIVTGENPEGGLKADTYVKVVGYVAGTFEGENAFGTKITAPQITAESIEVVDYATAVSPSLKTIEPNVSMEQFGTTITVTKVEFAKAETRVYFKIENNSANKFNFYTFNTKITQNGKQFEEQDNYNADYEEPSSDILAGITSEGVVAFPVLEQANFTIITDAHSDDYHEDFVDYTFEITVQ